MSEAQWQVAWCIYRAARDLGAGERRAFVESQSSDSEVTAEVLTMLEGSAGPAKSWVPPPTPARAGSTVGRYKVGALLKRGGMGEVYGGLDLELDRPVALKFLLPQTVCDESAASRFVREAKAASQLNHPNIVTIHEVVPSDSGFVIAMELVEGSSLREYCGTPLNSSQVLHYGGQVALALAAAHANNIVHRDIKPENVMVRPDGFAKVLDFGLARGLAGDRQTSISGIPLGTLRYMSPEQLRGEELTGASDVFSLGVMLYELAAGRHPFEAAYAWETAYAINNVDPGPPASPDLIPPAARDMILASLAKEAKDRPTAAEVAKALLGSPGTLARRVPASSSAKVPPSLGRLWCWMRGPSSFSPIRNLGVPALVVTLATGITSAVRTLYSGRAPITLLSAAVFIGALYGGVIGGLLATLLAIASVEFLFKETVYNLMGSDSNVLSLAIAGCIFTLIASSLTRARR
jgi:serine/threonine protein kinase